jgi:hypothetical protein
VKILIHAKNLSNNTPLDIEAQAEFLSAELEKAGHTVEWSNQSRPIRLILNKYDVLHILTDDMPLSVSNFLIVVTAKTIGLPVIVTNYAVKKLSFKSQQISELQLKYIDALSSPETGEIKNLRFFNNLKFILAAGFFQNEKINLPLKGSTINTVFHIENSFEELPDVKWDLSDNIYINATSMIGSKPQSEIRTAWSEFIQKKSIFKNAILILNSTNIKKILTQNKSIFITNYLKIHSIRFAEIISLCLETQTVLILSESQASGFPELWLSEKNGIVQNFNRSFTYQLCLAELHQKMNLIDFSTDMNHFIESKVNELTRLYVKLKTQKDRALSYANMPRRS